MAGRVRFDLTSGNPTRVDLPYDREAVLAAISQPSAMVYEPEPFGLRSARAVVAARAGVEIPPEHVVLTASTSEAYGYLFALLCDPGDDVLVPAPSYPLFEHLAGLS